MTFVSVFINFFPLSVNVKVGRTWCDDENDVNAAISAVVALLLAGH